MDDRLALVQGDPDPAIGDIGGYVSKVKTIDGLRTRYFDEGRGTPFFLCHGGGWRGNHTANTFVSLFPHLAPHYRVIAADKIGSGLTDNPPAPEHYTVEAQVAHMTAFIRSFGHDRIVLLGQSRGAYLAARIAVENPDMIRALILVNTATLGPEVGDLYARRRDLFKGRGLIDSGRAIGPDRAAFAEDVRWDYERLSYDGSYITDEFIAAGVAMEYTQKSADGVEMCYRQGGQDHFFRSLARQKPDTLEKLRQGAVQAPTLIYWGRDDPSAVLEIGHQLYTLIEQNNPRTRMLITNRAGHFHYDEHPAEFAHYTRAFLDHELS
ncbi:alpha/beta fold hydrolase [Celeribacter indicus]|uniref:Alpha/beta hydrolase fold protein n=1 Tax=Celeribacter indicus TaxID=1208324 RepID=A0A0B5DUN8_9RHOB|nr:alpha/beta hydrolase [Celeribacter indicus]AJE46739.1 alpha/beta hydrolase fold protein [Celeribacter indicus]SDX05286.1 Pimeloyl-ACP methyl ester carboxylesterase [Celeribacter indicus]